MAYGIDVGEILRQYSGGEKSGGNVEQDFDQVAQTVPSEHLQQGVAAAMRSSQTPNFADLIGQLFAHADSGQRASLLSQLIAGAGPGLINTVLGSGGVRSGGFLGDGAGLGAMGTLLGKLVGGGGGPAPRIGASDVDRLSPEQMQELAVHAERENPGVIDHVSGFLSQNPALLKSLGAGTLSTVLENMGNRNS